MRCKYCNTEMMDQGRDRIHHPNYSRLFICSKCQGVYERGEKMNGEIIHDLCKWWNPITKKYDK